MGLASRRGFQVTLPAAPDARSAPSGYVAGMANPYGIKLDDASLRWAAAEGVSEAVIAAICLLDERSVDKILAKLSPFELEQVIKIVGSPRGYSPGAYDALKGGQEEFGTAGAADREALA